MTAFVYFTKDTKSDFMNKSKSLLKLLLDNPEYLNNSLKYVCMHICMILHHTVKTKKNWIHAQTHAHTRQNKHRLTAHTHYTTLNTHTLNN